MKVYNDIRQFQSVENAVVTIGTFDGVHIGHQYILKKMVEIAKKTKGETVVITFFPHPRTVIHADSKNLKFITTQKRKQKLIESLGIDHLIIIPFTKEFSKIRSEEFIRNFVVEYIHPKRLIIGYDHHFGKNRIGDFKMLYDLGEKYSFKVDRIPPQDVENIAVSSTKIRKALTLGKVKKANQLLGHHYGFSAYVVHGDQIGRSIGFPTANLDLDPCYHLLAVKGVYSCLVEIDNIQYKGMANIGIRPTLNKKDLTYEVHIFDFNEDIYDKKISIYFVDRLRDEIKFDNLDALKNQLKLDEKDARESLQDI
ncbi:MAG: bifunctional riboflavin kinase/FAD synthetase [Bacteroidales bacterium]